MNPEREGGITVKKVLVLSIAAILLGSSMLAAGEIEKEQEAVRKVIEAAYINGIHKDWDAAAARAGFHPEFVMLIREKDGIRKLPIAEWTVSIEEKKKKQPEGPQYEITHEIPMVDVTGDAAVARVELYRDGKHIYTDYMSLYKFADGWKMVGKIYQRHE
jgi:ketosteroid isomerase-like protein